MKTIVETSTKLSKYLLADDVVITATATEITVGDPAQFIIADLNSTTVTITDNVTNAPARFPLIVSRTKTSENISVHEVGSGRRCVKSYIEDKSDNGE